MPVSVVTLSGQSVEERKVLQAAHDAQLADIESSYAAFFAEHGIDALLTPVSAAHSALFGACSQGWLGSCR